MDALIASLRDLHGSLQDVIDQQPQPQQAPPTPPGPAAPRPRAINPNLPAPVGVARTAPAAAPSAAGRTAQINASLSRWIDGAPPAEMEVRAAVAGALRRAAFDTEAGGALDLEGVGLTSLPDCLHLFRTIEGLDVSDNDLMSLPALPPNLTSLAANDNRLTSLPTLPQSLEFLDLSSNHLSAPPLLPDGLEFLDAARNNFTQAPITAAGRLPRSLQTMDLRRNPLQRFPDLPDGMTDFALSTHGMSSTAALEALSGLSAAALRKTEVLGTRESALHPWIVSLPERD